MIPFFVADRPMSLRIIKGLPFQDYPNARIGIMAHANTTLNFQKALCEYPCDNFDYCDAVSGPCQYQPIMENCPVRQHILSRTVKMCDSGIFTREGATLNYQQLFEAYERMGVEYGIMIDVFQDSQATLESARKALKAYESYKEKFKIVAVAHGLTVIEYLECYRDLRSLGFTHIAIGGLLRRVEETVRYTQVRDEDFMYEVLDAVREEYPDDWLFALGCFHPDRLVEFQTRNVWGDYKGWIFKYKKRNETLNQLLATFTANHLRHLDGQELSDRILTLQQIVADRNDKIEQQKNLSKRLFEGRRKLRALLAALYEEVIQGTPEIAHRFEKVTTHGLLKPSEEKLVKEALNKLGKEESGEANGILDNIRENRNLKGELNSLERQVDQVNGLLVERIRGLQAVAIQLPDEIQETCTIISDLIRKTDQEYRLEQVRTKISKGILALL